MPKHQIFSAIFAEYNDVLEALNKRLCDAQEVFESEANYDAAIKKLNGFYSNNLDLLQQTGLFDGFGRLYAALVEAEGAYVKELQNQPINENDQSPPDLSNNNDDFLQKPLPAFFSDAFNKYKEFVEEFTRATGWDCIEVFQKTAPNYSIAIDAFASFCTQCMNDLKQKGLWERANDFCEALRVANKTFLENEERLRLKAEADKRADFWSRDALQAEPRQEKEWPLFELSKKKVKGENSQEDMENLLTIVNQYKDLEKDQNKRSQFRADLRKHAAAGLNFSLEKSPLLARYLSSNPFKSKEVTKFQALMHYRFFLEVVNQHANQNVLEFLEQKKFAELADLVNSIHTLYKKCEKSKIEDVPALSGKFAVALTEIITLWFGGIKTPADYAASITALENFHPSLLDSLIIRDTLLAEEWSPDFINQLSTEADYGKVLAPLLELLVKAPEAVTKQICQLAKHHSEMVLRAIYDNSVAVKQLLNNSNSQLTKDKIKLLTAKKVQLDNLIVAIAFDQLPVFQLLGQLHPKARQHFTHADFIPVIQSIAALSKADIHGALLQLLRVCLTKPAETFAPLVNKIALLFVALEKPSSDYCIELLRLLSHHEAYLSIVEDLLRIRFNSLQIQEEQDEFVASLSSERQAIASVQAKTLIQTYIDIAKTGSIVLYPNSHSLATQLTRGEDYQALLLEAAKSNDLDSIFIRELLMAAIKQAKTASEMINLCPVCANDETLLKILAQNLYQRFPGVSHLKVLMNRVNRFDVVAAFIDQIIEQKITKRSPLNAENYQQFIQAVNYPRVDSSLKINLIQKYFDYCGQQNNADAEYERFAQCLITNNLLTLFITSILPGIVAKTLESEVAALEKAEQCQWLTHFMQQKIAPYMNMEEFSDLQDSFNQQYALLETRQQEATHQHNVNELLKTQSNFDARTDKQIKRLEKLKDEVEQYALIITPMGKFIDISQSTHLKEPFEKYSSEVQQHRLVITNEIETLQSAVETENKYRVAFKADLANNQADVTFEKGRFLQSESTINHLIAQLEIKLVNLRDGLITQNGKFNTIFDQQMQDLLDEITKYQKTEQQQIEVSNRLNNVDLPACRRALETEKVNIEAIEEALETKYAELGKLKNHGSILSIERSKVTEEIGNQHRNSDQKSDSFLEQLGKMEDLFDAAIAERKSQYLYKTVFQRERDRLDAAINEIEALFKAAIDAKCGSQLLITFQGYENHLKNEVIDKLKEQQKDHKKDHLKAAIKAQKKRLKAVIQEFKDSAAMEKAGNKIETDLKREIEFDITEQSQQLQSVIDKLNPKSVDYGLFKTFKYNFFEFFYTHSPITFIQELARSAMNELEADDLSLDREISRLESQKEGLSTIKAMNLNEVDEIGLKNSLNNINPKTNWEIYKDKRLNFWERSKAKKKIKHFIKEKKEVHKKFVPLSATQAVETRVVNQEEQLKIDVETLKQNQLKRREELARLQLEKAELERKFETVNKELSATQTTLKDLSDRHNQLTEFYQKIFDANQSTFSRLVDILYLGLSEEEKLTKLREEAAKNLPIPKFVAPHNNINPVCASPLYHAVLNKGTPEIITLVLEAMNLKEEEKQVIFEETVVDDKGLPVSVLFKAMQLGNIATVELLLKEKTADKNQRVLFDNKGSWTTLLLWAYQNQNEMVDSLIREGADLNITDSEGNTLLHLAVSNGDVDRVTKLLANPEFASRDSKNNREETALMLAATSLSLSPESKYELMTLLLANMKMPPAILKDDRNTYFAGLDKEGDNFLHRAIADNNLPLVEWLLSSQNRVLLNTENNDSFTPLAWTVKNNNLPMMTRLLQQPQLTGIHEAFSLALLNENCSEAVIAFFLRSGKVDIKTDSHFYLGCCRNLKNFQLLVKHGARIDVVDEEGNTILHQAVRDNDLAKVKFLIEECRMKPHSQNNKNVTPLMQLYERERRPKNRDMVNYLMQKTSVNPVSGLFREYAPELLDNCDESGNNVLHYVVRAGDIEAVKILARKPSFLMKENPLNKKNKDGDSAVHLLVKSTLNNADIVMMLGHLFQEGKVDLTQLDGKGREPVCYAQSLMVAKCLVEKRGEPLTEEELNLWGKNIIDNPRIKEDKEKIIKEVASICTPVKKYSDAQIGRLYQDIVDYAGKNKKPIRIDLQRSTLPDDFLSCSFEKKSQFLQNSIPIENVADVAKILDMGIPVPEVIINRSTLRYVDFSGDNKFSRQYINFWIEVLLKREEKLLTIQDCQTGNTLLHSLVLSKEEAKIARIAKEGGMYATEKNKDEKTALTLARELAHKPKSSFDRLFANKDDTAKKNIYANIVTAVRNRLVFELKFQCEKQLEIEKLIEACTSDLASEQRIDSKKQEQLKRDQVKKSQKIVEQIISDLDFGQYTEAAMLVDVFAALKEVKGGIKIAECLWELKDRIKNPAAGADTHDGSTTLAEALLTRNPQDPANRELLLSFLQVSDIAGRGNSLDQLADSKVHIEQEIKFFMDKEKVNFYPNSPEIEGRIEASDSVYCLGSLKNYEDLCKISNHLFESKSAIASLRAIPEKQQLAHARNMAVHIGLFIEANMDQLAILPSASGVKLSSLFAFARKESDPTLYIGVVKHCLTALGIQSPVDLVQDKQAYDKRKEKEEEMVTYRRAQYGQQVQSKSVVMLKMSGN